MKILFITHYAKMYGANKSMYALIMDLKKRYNITPVVFLADHSEGNEEKKFISIFKDNGIEVEKIKFYSWQRPKNKTMITDYLQHFCNFFLLYKILKTARTYNFDLIYTNSSVIHLGVLLSSKLNIPHVWHIREFGDSDYDLRYTYGKNYVKKMYKTSDRIIAISNAIGERVNKIAPNARCVIIENGVTSFKIEHKRSGNTINFCCIGVLTHKKNQIELLKATKILAGKHYTNFRIHLVGDGSPLYVEKLQEYIEENNIKDYVRFWGYQTNVTDVLKNMDVGVVPSFNEAFGRVTIEFMLAEMPVVGANSGGTKEIIQDNNTGYLYQVGNVIALAEKLESFINDSTLIEKMGYNGRVRALENYTAEKNTDRVYEIIKQLTDKVS